ncbi:uncharacterized protein BDCG_07437 [Blastomyces dermatitidis ER-3]|uniref:Uncharacterized protein n=1 Tax=Ajellomyces dermatitidis (strain ER-3 / ATCC MYA-2586) TaxID=559297 RepID=A0ABP2F5J3_AJEDR|nr:uncharacterized protein BDCG_07437 [Blastomyces dermatitidis ER-3]EEQ92317.2 hypothetical protein BDCG_07437 [Blastomyces dermatitidis ER-3]
MSTLSRDLEKFASVDNGDKKCSALSLVDEKPCEALATSSNGLFCPFHSRQCHGLYMGYKTRNAKLDELRSCPPEQLAKRSAKLANDFFDDLGNESALSEIHDHLLQTYRLLDRVIKARKLHHGHFYAQAMDYGHQKYLDALLKQKVTVATALERVTRRTAEVLYKKRKWFQWTTKCQEEEEKMRENEKKKIKREAALFRRQVKEVDRRMRELRIKEQKKQQDDFLQKVYEERVAQDAESWDPIEDVLDNERGTYISLIEHFLWLIDTHPEETGAGDGAVPQQLDNNYDTHSTDTVLLSTQEDDAAATQKMPPTAASKNKRKGKKGKGNHPTAAEVETRLATGQKCTGNSDSNIENIESREQMGARLTEGMKLDGAVFLMKGTPENPEVTSDRICPIPADEVDHLLDDIAEIKNYLFCRLLLGNAALLPAALRSSTINDFFNDPDVTVNGLRDICLKLEQPELQDIRDACADFARGDTDSAEFSDFDEEEEPEPESDDDDTDDDWVVRRSHRRHNIPDKWQSKREKKISAKRERRKKTLDAGGAGEGQGSAIDFGQLDSEDSRIQQKIRVKLCGRHIYNYPSTKSMSRGGWLHFSIIAKDCNFFRAVELCKSWEEFFELNILASYNYFPSPSWLLSTSHAMHSALLKMGFIPFYIESKASSLTIGEERIIGRRRNHVVREGRNYICAQMKRSNPVTRRCLQYVSMQASRMMLVVRDGKTGKILVKPPDDNAWLFREKIGHRRGSQAPWNVIKRVDEAFFNEMERRRAFRLGFDDFYDVYIWSSTCGEPFEALYGGIIEMLYKSHRVTRPAQILGASAPYLKTVTKDPKTYRIRDIKPGEQAESVHDAYEREDTIFRFRTSKGKVGTGLPSQMKYNEADALEDAILFPEEFTGEATSNRMRAMRNNLTDFEQGRIKNYVKRFAYDLESDEYNSEDFNSDEYYSDDEEDEWVGSEISDSSLNQSGQSKLEESDKDTAKAKGGHEESEDGGDVPDSNPSSEIVDDFFRALEKADDLLETFGPGPEDGNDMRLEFMEFLERQKAKIFKEAWHRADLEPHGFSQWNELLQIRSKCDTNISYMTATVANWWKPLVFLDYHPGTHSRVQADARYASLMSSLFFQAGNVFFDNGPEGDELRKSMLFRQAERGQTLPDRRGYRCPTSRGNKFFEEFDELAGKCQKNQTHLLDETPPEWDVALRPNIAHLFKEGVICLCYEPVDQIPGQAFAAREMDRPLDLFIDFRNMLHEIHMPPGREDPAKISIPFLRNKIKSHAARQPNARFSFLRVWSGSHFYPLMIGYDNRLWTSFIDEIGRAWSWRFIPKDMPFSDWSMHHNLQQRLEPYKKVLRDKVVIKRDMVLILAEDEEELLLLTSAVTFAIQTQPWRLEVDYWKSFINVESAFLDGLQDGWYD